MSNNENQSKARSKLAGFGAAEYAVFFVGTLIVGMFIYATFQLGNF